MKRRFFSVSLLSALSVLPAAVRRILALPAETASAPEEALRLRLSQTHAPPAGTVAQLPIGFEGDSFGLTAFAVGGEMLTKTVSIDLSPTRTPELSVRAEVPLVDRSSFPPAQQAFRQVNGMVNFDGELDPVPYSVIVVGPNRAWTAKGVQVRATGENLTVQTTNRDEAPIIITEQFGATPLDVSVSPPLRRLLEQRGVNVNDLIRSAKTPNLRQRTVRTIGGTVTFRVPDPPLGPEFAAAIRTVQLIVWSPVPITIQGREG